MHAALCVLASGSSGNCAVLTWRQGAQRRVVLIDLGLSPRRTEKALQSLGLSLFDVDAILLTHLDCDHLYDGWDRKLPRKADVYMHARHADASGSAGLNPWRVQAFEGGFEVAGVPVRAVLNAHDDLGSAAFRIDFADRTSLGYATDLGHVSDRLVSLMRGVDVLALESNHCQRMELDSGRDVNTIRRIMGGKGHLNNHQALDAIALIGPKKHVVLLHLSAECNNPELVASLHAPSEVPVTIAPRHAPTGWIPIGSRVHAGFTSASPTPV